MKSFFAPSIALLSIPAVALAQSSQRPTAIEQRNALQQALNSFETCEEAVEEGLFYEDDPTPPAGCTSEANLPQFVTVLSSNQSCSPITIPFARGREPTPGIRCSVLIQEEASIVGQRAGAKPTKKNCTVDFYGRTRIRETGDDENPRVKSFEWNIVSMNVLPKPVGNKPIWAGSYQIFCRVI